MMNGISENTHSLTEMHGAVWYVKIKCCKSSVGPAIMLHRIQSRTIRSSVGMLEINTCIQGVDMQYNHAESQNTEIAKQIKGPTCKMLAVGWGSSTREVEKNKMQTHDIDRQRTSRLLCI
jgi:hypothetical protein